MKRFVCLLLLAVLLAGCAPADYETMADVYEEPEPKMAANLLAVLPPDATVLTMESEQTGSMWLCDGYTVLVQTMRSGDLDATLRQVTGFGKDQLTVMERKQDSLKRYECSWVCAGEGGDQVGRAVILDDGSYHYALSLLTDAERAGELKETWGQILDTVSLDIVP